LLESNSYPRSYRPGY